MAAKKSAEWYRLLQLFELPEREQHPQELFLNLLSPKAIAVGVVHTTAYLCTNLLLGCPMSWQIQR